MASETRKRNLGYQIKRPKQEREPDRYKHFEDVLESIHPFGVYQIFTCLCIIFAQIEWTGNISFLNFVGLAEPDWACTMPDGHIIRVNANAGNKCDQLNQCSNFTAIKNSTNFHSILAQFKMVCNDKDKQRNIQLILASGLLFGSIIGGHMGDWFGRQFLFYMSQLFIVISSCLTIASRSWLEYSIYQVVNSVLYGVIEVETLTLMMEYTNNRFRMIPNACFQSNIANMVIALIALTTKDWQLFFIFLNLVSTPIIMAFMLFHESPRWLLAVGRTNDACNVLNDISNKRWNGTEAVFNSKNLDEIPAEKEVRWPNFYHLFYKWRFAKQSIMQILSMFTYALISSCYLYVMKDLHGILKLFRSSNLDNTILVVFLDGVFRVIVPVIIIVADMRYSGFTRRLQFLSSLTLIGGCFVAVIILIATGVNYKATSVSVLIIIAAMINDSAFWMNIVQITTQRYPTVLRCVAFGCLHGIRHIGTIVGVIIMPKLLEHHPIWAFIIPAILIAITLVLGFFLQPDTKGKALLDTLEEMDYKRVESALPKALYKMATMHRVMQGELHNKIVEENKDKWAEWQRQLDEKEQEDGGHYNHGADLSDDAGNPKTVNFVPHY